MTTTRDFLTHTCTTDDLALFIKALLAHDLTMTDALTIIRHCYHTDRTLLPDFIFAYETHFMCRVQL